MLRLAFFVALSLAIYLGFAYYGWRRLVRDTGVRAPWRRRAAIAIVGMQLLVPLTMTLGRLGADPVADVLAWPAFLWMAFFSLVVVGLAIVDVVRLVVRAGHWAVRHPPAVPDPARREVLARLTGGAVVTVVAGNLALGVRDALGEHAVVDVPVRLPRLPRALDGFTIVQITDVHVGLTVGRGFVAGVVERVNALAPDLVAITGDLVDGPVSEIGDRVQPLHGLVAPHGVYFINGNHEHYVGADDWLVYLRTLGIRTLVNERVEIRRGDAAFDLAGIDDHVGRPDLRATVAGRDASRALVLLAHQPRQARGASAHGVDLVISGHTHGGQIWPWHHAVSLQQGGLVAGRYTLDTTQLYVSRGVGYWGPPVRVGAPAEITRFILRAA